jgi:hypothetical protein
MQEVLLERVPDAIDVRAAADPPDHGEFALGERALASEGDRERRLLALLGDDRELAVLDAVAVRALQRTAGLPRVRGGLLAAGEPQLLRRELPADVHRRALVITLAVAVVDRREAAGAIG